MSSIITVTYENGVFRPHRPVAFKEHETMRIQVLPEETISEKEEVIQRLVQAGVFTPRLEDSEVEPISDEERRQLAEELGRMPGKPVSEIIIEERGEW